jgi:tetratricopeptide (TPR) repeat protein
MVTCNQCDTANSLDSKFCKNCGVIVPEHDLTEAQVKLDELISEGMHAFNEGRTEDASAIAEVAVDTNPSSVAALSLRGMCFERSGHLAEALECFEKIVVLNPDSALDKIKVNQLRNQMAHKAAVPEAKVDRRVALAAAAGAAVLVACIGSIAAIVTGGSRQQPVVLEAEGSQQAGYYAQAFTPPPQGSAAPHASTHEQPSGEAATQEQALPQQQQQTGVIRPPLDGMRIGSTLPSPGADGFRPFTPPGTGSISITPANEPQTLPQPQPNNSGPVRPPSMDPEPTMTAPLQAEPPKESPGIIDIRVNEGRKGAAPSTAPESGSSANRAEALARTGNQQLLSGNYQAAARSFEQALQAGGNPGSINQRLGQCYEKLGRNSDAIAAYTRAVAAYEAAIKAQGANSGLTAALEACRQALKVLRG